MTPNSPSRPRYKLGLHPAALAAAAAQVPVRDYTFQEIRRDGWTPGAIEHMHRILDDCLERGIDVAMTEHFELHDAWENSAECWKERRARKVTPKRRAWFASMKAEHEARRASEAAR